MEYVDDSTFFLKDLASVKKLFDIFLIIRNIWVLGQTFLSAGIGSLKGLKMAVWSKMCYLKNKYHQDSWNSFSYNKKFNMERIS